jgi:hypothetical protein
MLRKDIKAFIKAIRKHENTLVKQMLMDIPELVVAKAKSPPKKDDGQSPLQIAFKVGNFEAAEELLNQGADPDYLEESEINEWTAPVLHDAIRATIFNSRTLHKDDTGFKWGLRLIRNMLEKGANPNKEDSYGNNCGMRAVLDARQMILHPDVDTASDGTVSQVKQIFAVLQEFGADYDLYNEKRESTRKALINMGLSEYNLLPNKAISADAKSRAAE